MAEKTWVNNKTIPGNTPISAAKDDSPKTTDKTIKKGTNTELSKFDNNTEKLLKSFEAAEEECVSLIEKKLALPAYDQCLKASHIFNLLDSRGVIGVAERTGYINRIRELAKGSGTTWLNIQD